MNAKVNNSTIVNFTQENIEKSKYRTSLGKALLIVSSKKSLSGSGPEVFLRKGVLRICSKFTGEHLCRSVISIKLQS